jgi:hypothetical protein
MTRLVLDIPNEGDIQTLIPLFQRLGIRFFSESEKSKEMSAIEIIKAGCEMSNFGDAAEYQRDVRQDRILPFREAE